MADNRTPLRAFRCPSDVWEHAKESAAAEGTSVSAYLVAALRGWEPQSVTSPSAADG